MDNTTYDLDANVFIQAARRYYAFDLAPKFWDSLLKHAENERICSIDKVKGELKRGKDDLAIWATGDFSFAFVSTDQLDVIKTYSSIMTWVENQSQFTDAAKADFAKGADGWLVAHAKVRGCVVVTEEVYDPAIKRKVRIPNVCREFKVRSINTFDMLRELGIQFV